MPIGTDAGLTRTAEDNPDARRIAYAPPLRRARRNSIAQTWLYADRATIDA
jgi:hypothetical protein